MPQARRCAHWPLDGAMHIQIAAHVLRGMAEPWRGVAQVERTPSWRVGCIDINTPPSGVPNAAMAQGPAAFSTELRAQKRALQALADDFATVSAWLCGAAGASWDAARAARKRRGPSVPMAESHRVIAKDWLAADMNALISGVLRRAVAVLDRLDLNPDTGVDLAGQRASARQLCLAAELLDRAVSLCCDAALFVEDYDQRWNQIQGRVAEALALASNPGNAVKPGA